MRWTVCFLFSVEGVEAAVEGLRVVNHNPAKAVLENLPGNGALSPSTAAYHRSSKPELALLGFTQHLLKSIEEGLTKCTGLLESSRRNYDVAMEFSFDLSEKLVSLDDVDVSHFTSESEIIVKSPHQSLKVGNVLLGSLVGQWAKTPGSAAGLHSDISQLPSSDVWPKVDNARMGGLAHLSVIEGVTAFSDGSIKVATSKYIEEKIFRSGRTTVGWNHTKVTQRRRTDKEISTLLEGVDPSRRRLYNPGVCDSQCIEGVSGQYVEFWAYDRIGGCTYYKWRGDCNGGYYDPQDDDSEFCYYCFEYVKTIEAFNFNYNGDAINPGASKPELLPVSGMDNLICKNCWAYLGASSFVVVDWSDTFGLNTAKIGVTGTAGFNLDLTMQLTQDMRQSLSGTTTLSTSACFQPITIASILTITPTCILEAEVVGSFTEPTASVTASASYVQSTLMSAGYSNNAWSADLQETYNWSPPSFTYSSLTGEFTTDFIMRPKLQLKVAIGYSGVAEVSSTGTAAITPTLGIKFGQSASQRRLSIDSADLAWDCGTRESGTRARGV